MENILKIINDKIFEIQYKTIPSLKKDELKAVRILEEAIKKSETKEEIKYLSEYEYNLELERDELRKEEDFLISLMLERRLLKFIIENREEENE